MRDRSRAQPKWEAILLVFTAGQTQPVNTEGDWIVLDSFYGYGAPVLVRDQDSPGLAMRVGDVIPGAFSKFAITCPNASTLTVLVGFGPLPAREYATPRAGLAALSDVSCGAGALTQIVTGSPYQTRVHVTLSETAAGSVRLGGNVAVASATAGARLQPGATLTVATSADLYVFNPNGAAVTISLSRETMQ